jgi:uncharacterized protein (DUF2141 family)
MFVMMMAGAMIASTPMLGQSEGRCRAAEPGPAFLVDVTGLKDRMGMLKLELYPATEGDFLADDNVLIAAGKPFARVVEPVPRAGDRITLCIRAPRPGAYALSLLHDRDCNRRFGFATDGIGFSGNPRLGWSKPSAAAAAIVAGPDITRIAIVLNYRHGFGMRPIGPR